MGLETSEILANIQRHIKAGDLEVARKICKKLLLDHPTNKNAVELYRKLMLESKFLERKNRFTKNVDKGMWEERKTETAGLRVLAKHPLEDLEDEKNKLDQQIELIMKAPAMGTVEIEIFLEILNKYVTKDRPRYYAEYERIMTPRFAEVVKRILFKDLIIFTHNYLQFAKTVRPAEQVTDKRQKYLKKEVLGPFLNQLEVFRENDSVPELIYQRNSNNVLFITRHAETQSMYAPGKLIFAMVRSLLDVGKNVQVISLGNIDESFKNLMEKNSNFNVYQKPAGGDGLTLFHTFREEIKDFSPNVIFTEIEVSVLVAIEAFKLPSPIYLVSAGFYRIPWYSGILLTEELAKMVGDIDESPEFHTIPLVHLQETLAPYCHPAILAETKTKLNISNAFVIASFGRYEKFSSEFLSMSKVIVESIPGSMLILAGSNDQTFAKEILHDLIAEGKVKLLGPSSISVLGYCCDVFLDTFPQTTGFAALESMAKGKPVFSLDCESLEFYRVSRVEHLIFKSQEQLIAALSKAEKNKKFYNDISIKSSNFIENKYYNLNKLSKAIIKIIH